MTTKTIDQTPSSPNDLFAAFALDCGHGEAEITTGVKGVHCASCIRLIENALQADNKVVNARVNMTTERLYIRWKGGVSDADQLAAIVTRLGYQLKPFAAEGLKGTTRSESKALLRSLAIAAFGMGNLMLLSVALWSSSSETMGIGTRDLFHWLSTLIALPTIIFAGLPFFRSAFSVLRQGHTNMDVPISLAVILTSAMSLAETINQGEHIYFDSAVMLLFFLLIGRYLDVQTRGKVRESAENLLSLLRGSATVRTENGQKQMLISELRQSMIVLVAAGETIPADGRISKGRTQIDMSLISGESVPVDAGEGDDVFTGTVNLGAPVEISVAKASEKSLLSEIVTLMEKAEQGQAYFVRLADKAARLYTPLVHSLGLLTFLAWLAYGLAWQPALLIAVTVLIITCPCALGLAVPVVQFLATERLMKKGILLKSGDALEKLESIDIAVFDKTGTLTLGKPVWHETEKSRPALPLAASLANNSKHPLSRALSEAYEGAILPLELIEEVAGQGLKASYKGQDIRLGRASWCSVPDEEVVRAEMDEGPGLWFRDETGQHVFFSFTDKLRDDSIAVVQAFKKAGIETRLLSGDRLPVVRRIAEQLGLDTYHAGLSPIEKFNYLEDWESNGQKLLMVGDGLNDAPALARATVSLSPSTAMDIAQNSADGVFQGDKLAPVLEAWWTARQATRLVKVNFALAIVYNLFAIPLAMAGYVTPFIAALAMSGSSLVVIANSLRIRRGGPDEYLKSAQ